MNDEIKRRSLIIDVAVQMNQSGLSVGKSGNVSARCERGFLITPSGIAYDELTPEQLVFMDEHGKASKDQLLPSSEWRFHHDIYAQYPQAGGIVHCHSRHATALACCNEEIPPFHYMVAAAGGKKIPICSYALFGTSELSEAVIKALEGYRAVLMAHHGQVAYGDDPRKALELAEEVEELAAQYVLARSLGTVNILEDSQMDEVIERFKTYGKQEDDQ